jgi:hypothetical protein
MVREREPRGIVDKQPPPVNPEEALDRLLRDLRSRREGISDREAARRLISAGRNEIVRRGTTGWVRELAQQLVHPLALLLWLAALFAQIGRATPLASHPNRHCDQRLVRLLSGAARRESGGGTRRVPPQQARVRRESVTKVIDVREFVPGMSSWWSRETGSLLMHGC